MKKSKDPRRAFFITAASLLLIGGIVLTSNTLKRSGEDSRSLATGKAAGGSNAAAKPAVSRKERQDPGVIRYRSQDDGQRGGGTGAE